MSGNLDKIIAGLQKRTAQDIKRIEKEQEEKRQLWMGSRK